MATAFIALGSNLGDREAHLDEAVAALREHDEIDVTRISQWVETAPVDCPDDAQDFLNGVVQIETTLTPEALLGVLLATEETRGRVRSERNAPRELDLDVILYDDLVLESDALTIPHPRMVERHFVLWPLLQIAPHVRDPRTSEPFADALHRLEDPHASV